jgi:hypothetical protein
MAQQFPRPVNVLAAGAASGLAATGVMSVLMWEWRQLAGGGRQAPALITDRALTAVDLKPSGSVLPTAIETASHFAFGASMGVVHAALTRKLVRVVPAATRLPAPVSGAAYGLGVWAVMYGVSIPSVGLMPPPAQDLPGRQRRLIAAHLLYGATLGVLQTRRSRDGQRPK